MAPPTTPPEYPDPYVCEAAFQTAIREVILEHARMGRSVSEWRDGKIVIVTPAEIFARYGLDENGRPKAE